MATTISSWPASGGGMLRVGVDVVAAERIVTVGAADAVAERAFHPAERGTAEHLAGVLAAKEAVAKALGVTPPPWLDIAVSRDPSGRPRVALSPALSARGEILDASIAHDGGVAVASVLVRLRGGTTDAR